MRYDEHSELNPGTETVLEAVVRLAWEAQIEKDQLANESARIWAEAYQRGGAEAAKEALRERLIELEGRRSPAKEALHELLREMQRQSRAKQMEEQAKTEANEDSQ